MLQLTGKYIIKISGTPSKKMRRLVVGDIINISIGLDVNAKFYIKFSDDYKISYPQHITLLNHLANFELEDVNEPKPSF